MSSAPAHPPDRLARLIVASVGWTARHPWAALLGCLALVAASVRVSYDRLEYHTQRNDLLSAEKACQKRWQKYLDAFGDDDDMVVVAEGTDRGRMMAALDAVADRLKQRPDLFDRVFHRVDLRNLHDRALLFLPKAELEGVRDGVERMEPLLGSLGPLSWQMLSSQTLLAKGAAALEARAAGREPTPADRDLIAQLPAIIHSAAATLRDPAGYRNPWAVGGAATADRDSERQLTEPQYFFTPDGTLAMLVCRPKKVGQSFTPAKEAADAMRAVLDDVRPQFPELSLGLTGLPVLENDEMALSDADSQRASWLALLGVVALYFVVYRGFRYPLLTVSSLVTGTLWTLGWATVTVGHLNILSSTFAVMLIGMGDYGVLWVARYDEGRRLGKSFDEAMRHTAEHAGPTILTAAVTTALAFFATMLADFKAVAELGWIAGWGVLLCAASCLTLMPAALTIVERVRERRASGRREPAVLMSEPNSGLTSAARQDIIPFPAPQGVWMPGLAGRPRAVLAVGLVLLAGFGAFACRLAYDHNLLHLQPRGLESVVWEHKLMDKAAGATWDALSIAHSREEALTLKAKYEALPAVSRVVEVASLVPPDQEAKLPVLRAIHDRLAPLPPAERLPPPLGSSPAGVRASADRVRQFAGSDTGLSSAAAELLAALDAAPGATAAARLKEFDRRLAADLAADLHQLKAVSRPAPIALDDLPPGLRERYVGARGEFLVRAFARDGLWDYPALERFTAEAATADPKATGKAFRTLEGLRQMKTGFEWAGAYAPAAIVLVFLLDFRRLRAVLLGLLPLAAGVTLTLGVMGACGVPLNPANMIALPLVVGVGVDYGVHVLHDHRAQAAGRAFALRAAVGRGVLIKALTTVLGFGTLVIARHRGMASLGLVLTLGVTFCMAAALVWLPAVLRLLDDRERRKDAGEPRLLPLDRAKAA